MGVAQSAMSVTTGIMGIGYDTNEAVVSQGGDQYANLVDVMVSQGLIRTRSYSLVGHASIATPSRKAWKGDMRLALKMFNLCRMYLLPWS